ncbi:HEAT repeat domain-containing protein [Candidatus Ozemobacteraceae bacterium]|nr:HEAT repeat domain-containing protein [Candidatus Ozemobacteraceae bacterium]
MRPGLTLGLCVFLAFASYPAGAQTSDSGKISPALVKVKEFLRAKQSDKAVAFLLEELKKQPGNAQYLYALGYTYEINREPQKALEAFKQASRLNPEFPGLSVRIRKLEASLASGQPAPVDESTLTEDQKQARSLFHEALKEKGLGNFDKAFPLFAECVALDIGYLGGNDEGIIVTALNHYESKLQEGKDPSAIVFYNIYRFFRGDRDIAEKELNSFLAAKPAAPELAAVAEKWLKIIRNQQTTEKDLMLSYLAEKKRQLIEQGEKKTPKAAIAQNAQPASGAVKIPQAFSSSTSGGTGEGSSSDGILPGEEFRKNPRFIQALATINDSDPEIVALAAHQLGTFRKVTPEALEGLVNALNSTDHLVKVTAIEALRKIGPAANEAIPAVVGWLESDTPWMKIQALLCLGKICTQPQLAVPEIIKCLGGENSSVSITARRTLLLYGQAALPMLQEALTKPDTGAKKEIQEIIAAIQGGD